MRHEFGSPEDAERILIYGVTGSGKSTAALRLGEITGLPVSLVDGHTWKPGWIAVEEDEQRRIISGITSGDRWVLDSAYGAWLDLVIPRAELIVGLDYPRWFSLQRLIRRTVRGAMTREPRCNGNYESLRLALSRDSIVRWHFRSFSRKRRRLREWAMAADMPPVLLLRSSRELEAWLTSLHRLTDQ